MLFILLYQNAIIKHEVIKEKKMWVYQFALHQISEKKLYQTSTASSDKSGWKKLLNWF